MTQRFQLLHLYLTNEILFEKRNRIAVTTKIYHDRPGCEKTAIMINRLDFRLVHHSSTYERLLIPLIQSIKTSWLAWGHRMYSCIEG